MKYPEHKNKLYVYCHSCQKDITLEAQYIDKDAVYCGKCNERMEDEEDTTEY